MMMYRPGGPDFINGISCELMNIPEEHIETYLNRGWYLSVFDFPKPDLPSTGVVQSRASPSLVDYN
jgi:hypothetical protein